MKKAIIMFCVAMSLFATSAFAQLKEVRGIQTRSVEYKDYYENGDEGKLHGYELKNENNYDVWVELELKTDGFYYGNILIKGTLDTKSITLKAGETYVWKCGDRMGSIQFHVFYDEHKYCYIEYKAYKAE